ncbi:hypothetical protein D3C87_441220 [compost metagenome]
MINYKTLCLLPLLLLMSNCKTQSQQTGTTVSTNNTITINHQKQVKIPNSKISLKFNDVIEDSRCPVDVTCVWEGIAVVEMEATSGTEKANFKIGTRDFLQNNIVNSFSFSGYKFSLESLKPQPGAKPEKSSLTLKYEKEN